MNLEIIGYICYAIAFMLVAICMYFWMTAVTFTAYEKKQAKKRKAREKEIWGNS